MRNVIHKSVKNPESRTHGSASLYSIQRRWHDGAAGYVWAHRGTAGSFLLEVLSGRDLDPRRDFDGPDDTGFVNDAELSQLVALSTMGFLTLRTVAIVALNPVQTQVSPGVSRLKLRFCARNWQVFRASRVSTDHA